MSEPVIIDLPEEEVETEQERRARMRKARKAANLEKAQRGNIIGASSKNALDRLPPKKRTYVAARASGKTLAAACDEVGVSHPTGRKMEKEAAVQAAYRELIRKTISAKKLVKLIDGGANAMMPVYGVDGKRKKDRPDWKTRRPYIEMAAEHGGYHEKKADSNSQIIAVTVTHVGQSNGSSQPSVTASTKTIRAQ
jgi:hypothetical protein